ncbi:MAG: manganese efflux pump [Solobacterium sp.]|nr:manganese efflux pump [Solobacterium sp.]
MTSLSFLINSILLGIGLAMDAFSVSLANGLHNSTMKQKEEVKIASIFALFQSLMPMIGWICVHTLVEHFQSFETYIPWIALVLLCYIGGKMIYEGLKGVEVEMNDGTLLLQGNATSIDALSVGFTTSTYSFIEAIASSLIIGFITFLICMMGLKIGKKAGTHIASRASLLGGIILIAIGIEIFLSHQLKI